MKKNKIRLEKMKRGFTLMELMIVIVILGMLSALVLPNIMGKAEDAKQRLACIQMQNVEEALKSFKFDNGAYPETEEGLKALVKNPDEEKYKSFANGGYFSGDKVPVDPWKSNYIYLNEEGDINIISLGANGKEGGEESDKDITLKDCKK